MKRSKLAQALVLLGLPLLTSTAVQADAAAEREQFLGSYCVGCHNMEDFSGGLAFDLLPLDALGDNAAVWEEVRTKAGVGMMPPPGERQPGHAELQAFLASLEADLALAAQQAPDPGTPALHRLNAREYQNVIRDLLHLPFEAQSLLPADDSVAGFDNIAEGLVVSPALIQAYVSAAGKISRLAVGDSSLGSSVSEYRASDAAQSSRLDGLPLGTRGGVAATHLFPLDGEYTLTVRRSGPSSFMRTPVGVNDRIELLLDGERLHLFEPGEAGSVTLPVSAGTHTLAAAFVREQQGLGVQNAYGDEAASTRVTSLTVTGPLHVTGPGDTASRRRIFSCYPREQADALRCGQEIVETIASRAYRRPLNQASLDVLMAFFEEGLAESFETGVQYALGRILVDPRFLYRFEEEPRELAPGASYRIDDFDLASRLSFFLWSSIPDDELLALAGAGRLSEPAVLAEQVARMLKDPRSAALVDNFAPQWLSLQLLDSATPVTEGFDTALRQAMQRETELLLDAVLRGNRPVLELLAADYSFLNERLARHYGLSGIHGDHFRRVALADGRRMGLLGHASILTATSAPNRTSPVLRGTWILKTLLGAPPPEPPPGVEADIDVSVPDASGRLLTVRERLEQHRQNPSCASCHDMIDPIGYALENFDLVGRWRDSSAGGPIDASATLWDGSELFGPAELREALLARGELFVEALTENLMTYALGRVLRPQDMPAVREIVAQAEREDYRFHALVQGIVASEAFQLRRKGAVPDQVAGR